MSHYTPYAWDFPSLPEPFVPPPDAKGDPDLASAWLNTYWEPDRLVVQVRFHLLRALAFSWVIKGKSITALTQRDLDHLQRFSTDPRPKGTWIMARPGRRIVRTGAHLRSL